MAIAPLPDLDGDLELPWPRPALRLVSPPTCSAPACGATERAPARRPAPVHPRPRRRLSATTRRRRLLFTLGAAAVVGALALPVAALGGRPATAPRAPSTAVVVPGSTVYVVQPGDTLWSIASALDHGGDPRPLAEAIAKETGSSVVVPGERIRIP